MKIDNLLEIEQELLVGTSTTAEKIARQIVNTAGSKEYELSKRKQRNIDVNNIKLIADRMADNFFAELMKAIEQELAYKKMKQIS